MSSATNTTDFTQGELKKPLIYFTLPIFFGSLLQQMYQIADSVIVGQMIGPQALAAVSASTPVVLIVVFIMNGFASGVAILASQLFGAKKEKQITDLAYSTISVLTAICVLVSIIAIITAKPFLQGALGTPDDILADSVVFYRVYIASLPFVFLYNIYSFLMRAQGNSKAPMVFLAIFSIANVIMDIIFVGPLGMGVFGAGLATFIAQGLSVVMTMYYVKKNLPNLHIFTKETKFDKELFKRALSLGIPNAMQSAILGMSSIFLQRLVNSFGSSVVAARGVEHRISVVATQLSASFSRAIASFTGQNKGAGNFDRIGKALSFVILISVCAGVAITILVYVFNEPIVLMFVKQDAADTEEIVTVAQSFLSITALSYILRMVGEILMGVLRGAGQTRITSIAAVGVVALNITSAYFMAYFTDLGYLSIPISMIIMWPPAVLGMYLFYKSGRWKKPDVEMNEEYTERVIENEEY